VFAPYDLQPTPAMQQADGTDFVPTKPFYLLGQHFSAIAAAGPIAGPIIACQQFGWLPCILWIGLGVILIGAVHDFASLMASVRHRAHSVAEIAREHLGRRGWLAFTAFIWIALLYVIVAFTDITASTFVGRTDEVHGVPFNAGGAVAAATLAYLGLSIVMGLVQRRWNPPLWLLTIVFVPATLGAVWMGTHASTVFVFDVAHPARAWGLCIVTYCFIASLVPIWLLLQPRGYLGDLLSWRSQGIIGMFSGRFPGSNRHFAIDRGRADGARTPWPFLFRPSPVALGISWTRVQTTSKQIVVSATPAGRLRRHAARSVRGVDRLVHHPHPSAG
jgi:carbon starvation protein